MMIKRMLADRSYIFCGHGIQQQLSWLVLAESSMILQSKCHLGLQSLEGLKGLEGSLPIWLTHMAVSRSPLFLALSLSPQSSLSVLTTWQNRFPQSKVSKRGRQEPPCLLRPSLRCHTLSLPQYPNCHTASPIHCGRMLHKVVTYRR